MAEATIVLLDINGKVPHRPGLSAAVSQHTCCHWVSVECRVVLLVQEGQGGGLHHARFGLFDTLRYTSLSPKSEREESRASSSVVVAFTKFLARNIWPTGYSTVLIVRARGKKLRDGFGDQVRAVVLKRKVVGEQVVQFLPKRDSEFFSDSRNRRRQRRNQPDGGGRL